MDVGEVAFENVGDLATRARIAESYHGCRSFPNVFFPLIAPVVPFLGVDAAGHVQLLHCQSGSFLKDLPAGLPRLREWLHGPAREMPPIPLANTRSSGCSTSFLRPPVAPVASVGAPAQDASAR
jgi:hypothetical protein